MASDAGFKINDAGVRQALDKLRQSLPLTGSMAPAMQSMGRALKTATQLRFRTTSAPDGGQWKKSWRAQTGGGQTLSLTRRLRNSITFESTTNSVTVGTNVQYAAIHQFGGVVRAKNGPFLAIPVTPEARKAGSPRNMQGLHVQQTVKGQFVLANDKGVVQYLLRKQVTIPARPFLGVGPTDSVELVGIVERFLKAGWPG